MKNRYSKLVFDHKMEYAIEFTWGDEDPHWVNFKGVEVVGGPDTVDEGKYNFYNYDMGTGLDSRYEKATFEEAYEQNSMLHGYIKWDGCMEIHEWSHHWCGYNDIQDRIVRTIYNEGREIMSDRFDDDLANMGKLIDK